MLPLRKINLATTPTIIKSWRKILMQPKDIFSFGAFLFIVTFYFGFHPLWLALFTLLSLAGLIGMTKKPKEKHHKMAEINPF